MGLVTANADTMLAFWQDQRGLPVAHVLAPAPGIRQYKLTMHGAVLKLNCLGQSVSRRSVLGGVRMLLLAESECVEPAHLRDPDGNLVYLVRRAKPPSLVDLRCPSSPTRTATPSSCRSVRTWLRPRLNSSNRKVSQMAKMYPCESVDLSSLERPTFRNGIDLAVTPDQAFEVLADADAWPQWLPALKKVTWTSPDPKGVGTTRTVQMGGGIVANAEFIAWEPARRMTFRFHECSHKGFAAFIEDYQIQPTTAGCRLTWTVTIKSTGLTHMAASLARPTIDFALDRFLGRLRRYTDARFATAGQ